MTFLVSKVYLADQSRLIVREKDLSSDIDGQPCYLSVRQLAERIPYAEHTIRNMVSSDGSLRSQAQAEA